MNNRKKIAFISEVPTPYRDSLFNFIAERSNLDISVFYLSENQVDRKWTFDNPRKYVHSVLKSGHIVLRRKNITTFYFNLSIIKSLLRGQFDSVVIASYVQLPMVLAAITSKLIGIPFFIHTESHDMRQRGPLKKWFRDIYLKGFLNMASGCFAASKKTKEYLLKFGVKGDEIYFFPNTCDVELFHEKASEFKQNKKSVKDRLKIKQSFVLLSVGRLVAVKRFDTILQAVKEVIHNAPACDLALVVAGDGPEKNNLMKLAEELEIKSRVIFLDSLSFNDIIRCYSVADLFVLASEDEPYGVVVSEAMSCGLPCLLSDRVGAAYDLLEEDANGLLFRAGDSGMLAMKIQRIYEDRNQLEKYGSNAYEAARKFNFKFVLNEIERAVGDIKQ